MHIERNKVFAGGVCAALCVVAMPFFAFGQESTSTPTVATSTTIDPVNADIVDFINAMEVNQKDVTVPENLPEKAAILSLFESRKIEEPGMFSFMAFWVQKAVALGIPANTIFLILLTPFLATIISFVRVVVGLPTLDMLVPIALSFAFVAVGVSVGLIILGAILFAAIASNFLLSPLKMMFYPKRSLSMFLLAVSVFGALTLSVFLGFQTVLSLSIFPILILMLLGDSIVSVQMHKSLSETVAITGTTLLIGLLGFAMASSTHIQDTLILYPEGVLAVIPINILIGRYFGLRFLEMFRFNTLND